MYVHNKTKEAKKMETFYTITMIIEEGRKLVLSMVDGTPKWTFDSDKACYWESEENAKKYSKEWFKSFSGWQVEEIKVDFNKID